MTSFKHIQKAFKSSPVHSIISYSGNCNFGTWLISVYGNINATILHLSYHTGRHWLGLSSIALKHAIQSRVPSECQISMIVGSNPRSALVMVLALSTLPVFVGFIKVVKTCIIFLLCICRTLSRRTEVKRSDFNEH